MAGEGIKVGIYVDEAELKYLQSLVGFDIATITIATEEKEREFLPTKYPTVYSLKDKLAKAGRAF